MTRSARARNDWRVVDRVLTPFIADSVVRLLSAAADGPGTGHRLSSISTLWFRAIRRPPAGAAEATPLALEPLLSAVRRGVPSLITTEDCWLCDPRPEVRFDVGSARLRVHPGPFTDPIGALRNVAMIAIAADEALVPLLGFGIGDVLEVALRHTDHVVTALAGKWPAVAGERDGVEPEQEELRARVERIANAPAVVTQEEVDALTAIRADEPTWLTECASAERAARALAWATTLIDDSPVNVSANGPELGRTIRLQRGDEYWMVPAALTLSSVLAATAELAALAAADHRANLHLQVLTSLRVTGMLGVANESQADPIGDVPHRALADSFILVRGRRHAVAGQIVACLDKRTFRRNLETATARLLALDATGTADMTELSSEDVDIVRIVIYSGPLQVRPVIGPGVVAMHLTELEAMFDDALHADDLELLWQFLEDLSAEPAVLAGPADLLDAWRHWHARGTFDPTGSGALVLVDVTPDEHRWREDHAWESLEALLTESQLGARRTWRRSVLEGPGVATLLGDTGPCLVVAEPPFAIFPEAEPNLSAIGVDPSIAVRLANGLRWLLAEEQRLGGMIRRVGTPVIGRLLVASTELGDGGIDQVAIGVSVHPSRPLFSLRLDLSWLRLLENDPQAAHAALGEVLLHILAELDPHAPPEPDDELASEFRTGWRETDPLLLVRHESHVVEPPPNSQDVHRNLASRRRGTRLLAEAVLSQRVDAGVYEGQAAVELCRQHLTDAAESALDTAIADWSPSAVRSVLTLLNVEQWRRQSSVRNVQFGLMAPWAAEIRDVALADAAHSTRSLELLVEWLLARTSRGRRQPDQHDIAPVVELAELVLSIGVVRSGTTVRLHDSAIIVLPTGMVDLAPLATFDDAVDLPALFTACRAHPLRISELATETDDSEVPVDDNGEAAFQSVASTLPPSLQRVDRLLLRDLGFPIDAIIAVLATAADADVDGDGLAEIRREDLIESCASWSGVKRDEIDAATSLLTLGGDAIRGEELAYWEIERRAQRLTVRPLVEVDGGALLVAPHCVRASQQIIGDAFLDGRLPWPKRMVSTELVDALARHRQVGSRGLERAAAAVAESGAFPHRVRLEPHQARSTGLALPGEVDLLVADNHQRIWVVEVKDHGRVLSASTIRGRVRDYTERGGYFEKLRRKVEAIGADVDHACELLGIDAGRGWEVRGAFVTKLPEPAAFLRSPRALFVLIDDMRELLSEADVPETGHFRVGSSM